MFGKPKFIRVEFFGGPVDGLLSDFETDVDHFTCPFLSHLANVERWHVYIRADPETMIYWGVY